MAQSCQHYDACISNNPINCQNGSTPTIINKERFADRLRCHWLRTILVPEAIDMATAGSLLWSATPVFKPLLTHSIAATSKVGAIDIGGLGHLAIKLLRAMGCEVTAFSSSPAE